MNLQDRANSIVLWLRGIETQLENLEESALWKSVNQSVPGDYVRVNFNDSLSNCIAEVFDLANRFEELQQRLQEESNEE